jgi:hypothetical protein
MTPLNEHRVSEPILSARMLKPFFDDSSLYLEELQTRQADLEQSAGPVRDEMLRLGFIRPADEEAGRVVALHAVDSSSHDITLGSLCTSIGLAINYCEDDLPRNEWIRISGPNTEAFRHVSGGIRLQLELRLLAQAEHLTIADLSNWSMLMDSNKVITAYENIGKESDLFSGMMEECFDSSGARTLVRTLLNPNLIAMSKIASSAAICKSGAYQRFFAYDVSDRILMGRVLCPGERTREMSLKETASMGLSGQVNIERRRINDQDRSLIEKAFKESLFVTFYRPWEFQGAYRIEFHRSRFPTTSMLSDLFATIKYATRHPEFLEPIPQYMADHSCKVIHQIAQIYGSLNMFRSRDILRYSRTSNLV